ncbi:MAG: tetratricopeptide repeat protein [Candidatus Anstonellales archaeon]
MTEMATILDLVEKKKYGEAATLLDEVLIKQKTPELYYLRGIISMRLKNYDYAIECLEKAMADGGDKKEIFRAMASAYIEQGKFLQAKEHLEQIDKKDVDAYFLLAISSIFLNDPISAKEYMNLAYLKDRERTKELLEHFYSIFIRPNPELTEKEKEFLWEKIRSIR